MSKLFTGHQALALIMPTLITTDPTLQLPPAALIGKSFPALTACWHFHSPSSLSLGANFNFCGFTFPLHRITKPFMSYTHIVDNVIYYVPRGSTIHIK